MLLAVEGCLRGWEEEARRVVVFFFRLFSFIVCISLGPSDLGAIDLYEGRSSTVSFQSPGKPFSSFASSSTDLRVIFLLDPRRSWTGNFYPRSRTERALRSKSTEEHFFFGRKVCDSNQSKVKAKGTEEDRSEVVWLSTISHCRAGSADFPEFSSSGRGIISISSSSCRRAEGIDGLRGWLLQKEKANVFERVRLRLLVELVLPSSSFLPASLRPTALPVEPKSPLLVAVPSLLHSIKAENLQAHRQPKRARRRHLSF